VTPGPDSLLVRALVERASTESAVLHTRGRAWTAQQLLDLAGRETAELGLDHSETGRAAETVVAAILAGVRTGRGAAPGVAGRRLAVLAEDELLVSTSGSTTRPRAIVRSIASWEGSFATVDSTFGLHSDDVFWAPGPLSSTLTLFSLWHALGTGRTAILDGPWHGRPAPEAAALATVLTAVPTVLEDVVALKAGGALPRLRLVIGAGAPAATGLRDRAAAAGLDYLEYYGAAELSFVGYDPDGAGYLPFPEVTVEIRRGLIWVRSPWVASRSGDGQAGDQPRNEPWRRDRHGWHSVGDHGQWITAHRFTVSGRGLGTATVGGHTVILDTVESTLRNAPGVRELICVAIPHPRFGECIVATLRPEPGTDPIPHLRARARRLLPAAARPVRYLPRPEWPISPGGKVSRAAVREEVLRAIGRPAHQTGSD
jgi:acyl-CoA synthetase (AMP-forming)/AMP-acid ligase II